MGGRQTQRYFNISFPFSRRDYNEFSRFVALEIFAEYVQLTVFQVLQPLILLRQTFAILSTLSLPLLGRQPLNLGKNCNFRKNAMLVNLQKTWHQYVNYLKLNLLFYFCFKCQVFRIFLADFRFRVAVPIAKKPHRIGFNHTTVNKFWLEKCFYFPFIIHDSPLGCH